MGCAKNAAGDVKIKMKTKPSKQLSLHLCVFVIAIVSLGFTLASEYIHAGHKCSGDDCPVCLLLKSANNTLRSMSKSPDTWEILHTVFPALVFIFFFSHIYIRGETPVTKKIRKNN